LLARHGIDLVLHGHDHRHMTTWINGPRGRIPAVGVPSASAIARGHNEPAAYNLFSITRHDNRWRCDIRVRGFADSQTFGEIRNERLI
jgi:3',5'-cyclic AMP phosphodiesterase CpdA